MPLLVNGAHVSIPPFAADSGPAEEGWGPRPATVALMAGTRATTVSAPGGAGQNGDPPRLLEASEKVFVAIQASIDGAASTGMGGSSSKRPSARRAR